MTALYCPNCGTEAKGQFKFCPSCGTKLPDIDTAAHGKPETPRPAEPRNPAERITCPTCGFENAAGTRSCESCGSYLGGADRVRDEKRVAPVPADRPQPRSEAAEERPSPGREKRKPGRKDQPGAGGPQRKRFHFETYQIVAAVAAILLGGVLIYGLATSKTTPPESGGGSMPAQQSGTTGKPSADVLHEIDRLREVVSKEPDDLGSLLRLSNMLQDNGFYDQATIYYKLYLGKVPKNVDARVDYGVTLFEDGHTQDAIDQLKEALTINPKHQIGLFNLGIVYLNAGEFDKANEAFKKCVQVDPNSEIGKKAEQTLKEHANFTSQEVN